MAEGVIKWITGKGFGYIDLGGGKDIFFHRSAVEGARFEDLREGQRVSFTQGQSPKGPRPRRSRRSDGWPIGRSEHRLAHQARRVSATQGVQAAPPMEPSRRARA